MPFMQALVERLNIRFNRSHIDNVNEALLAPGTNVADAAVQSTHREGAIQASDQEKTYIINHYSQNDLDVLRRELLWAVSQRPRVGVQFLWVPGPDYKIEIFRVAGTDQSEGGVSVLLHGPTDASVDQPL